MSADCFDVAWLFADLLFCGLCSVCAGGSSQCICLNGTPNDGLGCSIDVSPYLYVFRDTT